MAVFEHSNLLNIFQEISASKYNRLCNSDSMVYALQLKQKSSTGVFCKMLEELFLRIIWDAASEKKTEEEIIN